MLAEALEACAAAYGETILYSNARNRHLLKRIQRIMNRTVRTLQIQLQKGQFLPEAFEVSFDVLENLDSLNIALGEKEKMRLRGRIDRVDVGETEDRVYVKVIDYKSGERRFDLAALYYGLQLQLVVYMNAAVELVQKKYPDKEAVPAAMLYYRMTDPVVEGENLTPEEVNAKILQELKMTGIVNKNDEAVKMLDQTFTDKSEILPLGRKKDGTLSVKSSVISEEDLQEISRYVNLKIKEIGSEIMEGKIGANPCLHGKESACDYCSFRSVCGFDARIPGYHYRQLEELKEEEAMEKIKERNASAGEAW